MKRVETAAQRLDVDRKNATPARWRQRRGVQLGCMDAECDLDVGGIKTAENGTDRRMRRRPLPAQPERFVQAPQVNPDERMDTPVRVSAGHDRQDRKQQNIALLRSAYSRHAGVGDRLEPGQNRGE